ncbi:GTPase IMAP family member 8-like isoform X2 [Thunnus thynnus]|uniref:GTPase IMAP family member 8-like isoform X2 n=1 Tax=Thunnus thynnus TaxID=8237 RepID=UPI0035296E8B
MGGDIGELGNRSSMVTSWMYKAGKGFAEGVSHISLPPGELRLTVRRTNSPQNPKPTDQPSTSHSQTPRKESTNGLEKIFKTDIFLLNYLRDNHKAFKVLEKQLSAIGCNLRELRVDVSFIPVPRQAAVTKVQLVRYSENVNKLKEVLQDYQMNQIEHLQNVHLQCIYEEQMIHISDKIRQAGGAGEKLLYHRTTQDSCDSSMTTGFNRRFARQNERISIIILGSGDSLKKALITNILGKDLSVLSKRGNEMRLKIYENDTYEFICTPSNDTECKNIKELVDKHPDMWLLVVEDGFSPKDVQKQIEKLHKTTRKPTDEFIVVLQLGYKHEESYSFKFCTMEQIVKDVRKLAEDRHLKATNKGSADQTPTKMDTDEPQSDFMEGTHSDSKLNLVLLGMHGTGKSASGNTILGKKQFVSEADSMLVTTEWQVGDTEISGTCVRVIDTPDIFNDKIESLVKNQYVTKCKQLLQPGPCVFLLVMNVGRLVDGERDILRKLEKTFDNKAKEQTVILFTRGEDLQRAKKSLEVFLRSCNSDLKKIVDQCGRRCVVFENNSPCQCQVTKLMQTVIRMLNKQQNQ